MHFEHPLALALLALALGLTWASATSPLSPLRRFSRGRRYALLVAQTLCLGALALALSEPSLRHTRHPRAVLLVLDRSRSTDHVEGLATRLPVWLREATRGARPGDRLGLVEFAATAHTTLAPGPVIEDQPPPVGALTQSRDASALRDALLHALGALPHDAEGRLVLLSDGDETHGSALDAATLAAAAGVPVDVLPLLRPPRRDVAARRLRAVDRVSPGSPVDLAFVLHSDVAVGATVTLRRDGQPLGREHIALRPGEEVIHLRDTPLEAGLHRYEARVESDIPELDSVSGNEAAYAFVRVTGEARALVVAGRAAEGGGEALAEALRRAGIVTDRVGPGEAPGSPGAWARYDLVALDDVRARELDPAARATLGEAVRTLGLGLLMAGSDRAFGPGGWAGTPVEAVLPVTLDLRNHRTRGDVALVIVIDRSGSMAEGTRDGRSKLTLANEGAARAAGLLHPTDLVAIAHVDTEVSWTLPLRRADDTETITRRARGAGIGGGGIFTEVALDAAYALLRTQRATVRHVLLLADGDDAENSEACAQRARQAAATSITTSVVAIGRGHDEPHLAAIAREGLGRYYLTEDARSLPEIFTEDTALSARNPLRESPFVPRFVRASTLTRGVDLGRLPTLDGYVVTELRPRAEALALALDDDPWLARWEVGAGRAAALTSDLDGRWSADFLRWPGSGPLMGQLGRWLLRGVRDHDLRVTARSDGAVITVEAEAESALGGFDSTRELEAHLLSPGGVTTRVPLTPTAPGRYDARIDAARPGTWLVSVIDPSRGLVGVTGAEVVSSAELNAHPGNEALLAAIADRTQGALRRDLNRLYDGPRRPFVTQRPLSPALLALALAAALVAATLRRVPEGALARLRRPKTGPAPIPESDSATPQGALLDRVREARRGPSAATPAAQPGRTPSGPAEGAVQPPDTPAGPPPEAPKGPAAGLDALVAQKRARRQG
ncbi:MAG: VWA domain-containing protein [Myxococcales bacterium]|nr:VWA domain-containing protein [Myxococcales bacterium]